MNTQIGILSDLELGASGRDGFVQCSEKMSFGLGDEWAVTPNDDDREPCIYPDLYIIERGRVRIVAIDRQRQREVCAAVLQAGDLFGADDYFDPDPLPYRAIAASDGILYRLARDRLPEWIAANPGLATALQERSRRRQRQIFYKTCVSETRSHSSHDLAGFVPHLQELHLPAGARLRELTPARDGRFWLRRGELSPPQAIGSSWGYPDDPPEDAIAASELWLYVLPRERWERGAIVGLAGEAPPVSGGRAAAHSLTVPVAVESETDREVPNRSEPEPGAIAFPKPLRRRLQDWFARYPTVRQQSSSDCGAACLASIGQYWGKRWSLNALRELAGVGRSGIGLKNLAKTAEQLGFHARPVRASFSRLAPIAHPWIAHWEGMHYVVVYRVRGDRLWIGDPAIGNRTISREDFLASWTGYALVLDPGDRLQDLDRGKTSLTQFGAVLWPYRSVAVQIVLASLLLQIFGVITPLFTQIILDRVVVTKSLNALNIFALGLLLFGVGAIALGAVRQYLLDYFSNRIDLTLIAGFIRHALSLPLKFFESRRVGDIITRVQENQKIQHFLIRQVVLAWLDFLMGFIYLGLMAYYNWHLTLLVLAMIPPIALFTAIATPFMRRVSRQVFNSAAEQNSTLVEMMSGVATLKATASEVNLRWRWEDHLTQFLNAQFRGQKLGNTLQSVGGLINTVGSTVLLWYGATLVIQDRLSIGQLVAFNMMLGKVINPVLAMVNLWDELQEVWISLERLDDVFGARPEETPQQQLLVLPTLRGTVKCEALTFRYDDDQERNTLENISFEIEAGQTVAVVGRSGSGKTTLMNLLQGLYGSSSGRIVIDGHDIRHVSPSSLRRQIGVVPQECFLFSGTILDNITLYREDATLEAAIAVAKLAEAHGFVQDLPLGYYTKVGERGSSLSGGQRQRIAIARALLGNPRILILDEATSSLDTESERRFQQNLTRISRDRTTIVVAHRLSTVRHADCILVLDRGVLVERGTHKTLMAARGLYYHLAQQQLDL
ncbi:peptidase domain-containing ABC transporter [Oxynema sp. CENA135]|uniref:ABC transporter transmembrane domain-containing protein n=1 Tax=Oxynema sp. CENA135 TaxID=984206 RepID=UPI00190DF11B|nr:peptidase domain-containing ABC transporter [Oxynema sp. CENA135]MBK4731635.1 peptidase domain-containing ABC transporter [Oxynema sp. CENA135]